MADYTRREAVTKRIEYVLPNPTNWAEVRKAIGSIAMELDPTRSQWDDTVTVEARDDEIVFSYEVTP